MSDEDDGGGPYDNVKTALREICDNLRRNHPSGLTRVDLSDIDGDSVREYAYQVLEHDGRSAAEAMDLSAALQDNTVVTSIVGFYVEVFMNWGYWAWENFDSFARLQHFFRTSQSLRRVHLIGCPSNIYLCEYTSNKVGLLIRAIADNTQIGDVSIAQGLFVPASAVEYLLLQTMSLRRLHVDVAYVWFDSTFTPNSLAKAFGANTRLGNLSLHIEPRAVPTATLLLQQLASHARLHRLTLLGSGVLVVRTSVLIDLVQQSCLQELVVHVPCATAKRRIAVYCQRNARLHKVLARPAFPCQAKKLATQRKRTRDKRTNVSLYPSLLTCAVRPKRRASGTSVLLGLLSLGDSIDAVRRKPSKKRRLDLEDTSDEE